MSEKEIIKPDYIFETSWEVCNKVGGIYTVISTKAPLLVEEYNDNYILIGPDVWKETHNNPDFIEDKLIYKSWRKHAESQGLYFKIGRWNIPSKPIAILVDFTPFFNDKDKIFTEFWEKYRLDSIHGKWDYIEPVMFGYAAARIIESFYDFNLSAQDKIIAQFHEWMTGAGILYLKDKVPQVGCVFTTHATVMGRSIAGNQLPLYSKMNNYNLDSLSLDFGVNAKYSIEKISAEQADCFTTVSQITADECSCLLKKNVDIITPNGFDDSFVPKQTQFDEKRKTSRNILFKVAEALLKQKLPDDSQLLINSGRYEFKNKGVDLFIDALGALNKNEKINKTIIAFITIPANHSGPKNEILDNIENPDFNNPTKESYLTHHLLDFENDPILKRIKENNLQNKPEDKVKIIFVPSYLNGNDGIFNIPYYELLIGFDVSVFPSYYEPWGYTPLESVAFHIPTITTTLAGFGKWINNKYENINNGALIVERNDDNDAFVVEKITKYLTVFNNMKEDEYFQARKEAFEISRIALWGNLIQFYKQAYSIALAAVEKRHELFADKVQDNSFNIHKNQNNKPQWRKVLIKPKISEKLKPLLILSKNLWWTWNYEASEIFEMINPHLWEKLENNPIHILETLSSDKLKKLEENKNYIQKLNKVYDDFLVYMSKSEHKPKNQIAYFSMEFGLHDTLKIFSGGLGILAGDYLKEASDQNQNMIGIGLLYRYGYFKQTISLLGDQMSEYVGQKFTHMPIEPVRDDSGNWIEISIALPGRTLFAKVWQVNVGRIKLYLLDADLEKNIQNDRFITHQLYGGDIENRFKQELLLGVGGIRLMEILNIEPDIYHCNEGHAAFIGIERLRKFVQHQKLSFNQGIEVIRASTLFTTHTPVPAGHDVFDENILRTFIPHYAERLNISWETFMSLGKVNINDPHEKFSMSVLAAKLSQEMNGVSKIHGDVSRKMFSNLYEGYYSDELHIAYVTNGVHYPSWTAKMWKQLYDKTFGENFISNQSDKSFWKNIFNVDDSIIWETRNSLRKELIDFLKNKLEKDLTLRQENPKLILKILNSVKDDTLTIGFARRFATYKRANLLFSNLERLSKIINNEEKPVQFVFAGKAHPNDKAGQEIIKRIIEVSKLPEFLGKILFVENYNIELGKKLVQGVDVWLNTPTRPMEASGTSGEKAVMNGVLNFSVLDGWWAEGYRENAGWALKEERTYMNQELQDELDTETIYSVFEEDIIPLFYEKNENNIPVKWISFIKKNIAEIAPDFTMKRMLDDYYNKFYKKLFDRNQLLIANNFDKARQISSWKRKIIRCWNDIEVLETKVPDSSVKPLLLGENFNAEIVLNIAELDIEDIGIEVIFANKENDIINDFVYIEELKIINNNDKIVTFSCNISSSMVGVYNFVFRIFPKHELLPHRQDFPLIKWV